METMPMCQELVNLYVVSVVSEDTLYREYFLNPELISGVFCAWNQIGFEYKNYTEFMFVLEFRNGEEGREKEEGRKCFTFFRLFSNLLSSPQSYVQRL